jgi:hypothetical protein
MTQSICSDYSTEGVGNRGNYNWTRGEYDKHNLGKEPHRARPASLIGKGPGRLSGHAVDLPCQGSVPGQLIQLARYTTIHFLQHFDSFVIHYI